MSHRNESLAETMPAMDRHHSGHLWSKYLHHRQIGNPTCSRVNSEDTARTRARTGMSVGAIVTAQGGARVQPAASLLHSHQEVQLGVAE